MSEILYHYTSVDTLYAILNNVNDDELKIRATHVNYLNDNTENEIAVNILKKKLLEFEAGLGDISNKKFANRIDDKIEFFKNIDFNKLPPFVFSLSEEKDSLPMWNTYADKSLGVAIGFNKSKVVDFVQHNKNYRLIKCDYNNNKTKYFLDKNIQNLYQSIMISNNFVGVIDDADNSIWLEFEKLVPLSKDSNYKYEKEWRVIIEPKFAWDAPVENFEKINFNVVNGLPKPFVEFKWSKDFISEIVVGPCSNYNLVSRSIFMMLSKIGLKPSMHEGIGNSKNILISSSDCPFRQI